eukprot:scaffold38294_cov59-Phaeocystis_antarctica.AAC.2
MSFACMSGFELSREGFRRGWAYGRAAKSVSAAQRLELRPASWGVKPGCRTAWRQAWRGSLGLRPRREDDAYAQPK